jgi:nicotinamidase-related amidase
MIDMQEKLFPHISSHTEIGENSVRLLAAARLLDIPLKYTEQYPKGIGGTDEGIAKAIPDGAQRFEKNSFSCLDAPGFAEFCGLAATDIVTVVWGIEAHICVMSTVMDMIERDLPVAVVMDASGSRRSENRDAAFDAMRFAGALVIPTESVVYQLLEMSGTAQFKAMLPFFK